MDVADWAQALSFPVVAAALLVSAIQTRAAVQQTKHVAAQTESVADSLVQGAHLALTKNHIDHRESFFRDDPELLAWYLSSRGYLSTSHQANKKRLYVLTRMDTHHLNYLNRHKGFLADEFWEAWQGVIVTDFEIPEFLELWPTLRRYYAPAFAHYCDRIVAAQAGKSVTRPLDAQRDVDDVTS